MIEEAPATGLRRETEAQPAQMPGARGTIVVLGDSIAYGWGLLYHQSFPAVLERLLHEGATPEGRWRVVNAGVPGDTALMGWARYARDVTPFRPQMVILCFGLNDAALRRTQFDAQRERLFQAERNAWARLRVILGRVLGGAWSVCAARAGGRHRGEVRREPSPRVRPRLFVAALRALVRRACREGAHVCLMAMTPMSEFIVSQPQRRVYERYGGLIQEVCRRERVPLVAWRALGPTFSPEPMLAEDGLHLTAAGQEWLAAILYAHLRTKLGRGALSGRRCG